MYLGIDLGTSGVKTILIDREQKVIATANSSLEVYHPHKGWSEQNPQDWIRATEKCLDELKAKNSTALASLRGIGLSGQQHGATLLDDQNNPLRPCILWNDTRSHVEAAELNGQEKFQTITGNLVFPGYTAPKLLWIQKHEREIFLSISKVLLPKDYLRFWLTGEYISDMSDSAGTSWLDVKNRCWSKKLLDATGLNINHMPKLVEGTDPAGKIRRELAKRWNIPENVIIAGGAGDNAASACGVGTIYPGTAFISIGTSGVLFTSADSYEPNPQKGVHTFCHTLPNRWHHMGVILSATDSLNWLARITNFTRDIFKPSCKPNELISELGQELRRPSEVLFLPYLSGERTPHNDAKIRGCFIGLSQQTDRVILTQAVLEGVAFAFRDCLEALQESEEQKIDRIIAIGGGAQSIYWLKAIATVLGVPIDEPKEGCDLGAAFGAARLALIAAENLTPEEICKPPPVGQTIEPDFLLKQEFEEAYKHFRNLYPAICSVTHK